MTRVPARTEKVQSIQPENVGTDLAPIMPLSLVSCLFLSALLSSENSLCGLVTRRKPSSLCLFCLLNLFFSISNEFFYN